MKVTKLLLLALVGAAGAAQPPVEDYAPEDFDDCEQDIQAFCKDVKYGAGRKVRCIGENATKVSAACKDAVSPSDFPDGRNAVSITVTVDGIRSDSGVIWVLLSDDADSFPRVGKRMSVAPAHTGALTVTFRHLKPGKYAVLAYHDANENSELDMTLLRRPKEGIGFSNNVTDRRPSFKPSSLDVTTDIKVPVKLAYP